MQVAKLEAQRRSTTRMCAAAGHVVQLEQHGDRTGLDRVTVRRASRAARDTAQTVERVVHATDSFHAALDDLLDRWQHVIDQAEHDGGSR